MSEQKIREVFLRNQEFMKRLVMAVSIEDLEDLEDPAVFDVIDEVIEILDFDDCKLVNVKKLNAWFNSESDNN